MSRVSVAERTKLSVFLARGLLRRFVGRVLAHPLVQWPFSFGKADRLLIAPQDLRTLPCHFPDPDSRMAGLDGFYAVRLQRI